MKKQKFWLVMAAAAVLSGMVMTSCSKDDDPIDPPAPEVVDSEVLDSGCSSRVEEAAGTNGTSLTYESWIYVRQTTRATSDNKISVTLFNRFNNVVEEAEVSNFDFGTAEPSITYRVVDSRVEQNFVTVTDSVLVYSLVYENGFKLEYELLFETPEYNDGVTKQAMPYYRIGNIIDNGMTLSGMENQESEGKTWFRKLLGHSITVEFNGQSYDVSAAIVVRCELPAEDVLLSSRKIGEGLEIVSTDMDNASGVYRTWIEIEQEWSQSGVKTFKKEALLKHSVRFPNEIAMQDTDYKFSNWNDFQIAQTVMEPEMENERNYSENVTIRTWQRGFGIVVTKPDAADFRTSTILTCIEEKAFYKDDKLSCEFPCPAFSALDVSFVNTQDWQFVEDDEVGNHYMATCRYNFSIGYGESPKYTSFNPIYFIYFEN